MRKLVKAEPVLTPFGFTIRLVDQHGRYTGDRLYNRAAGYHGLWTSEIVAGKIAKAYNEDGPAGVWPYGAEIIHPPNG